MTFSPKDFWDGRDGRPGRGSTYEAESIKGGWWDGEQEGLAELLETLTFSTVLEVGCGFGRVGASIKRRWPEVKYTGLDISLDLIEGARKRLPDSELIYADLATWESDRKWDLVVAVSVLGHVLPTDIEAVIAKLRKWARNDLVAVDWDDVGNSTSFQWGHDYVRLYGDGLRSITPYGRQSMFHLDRP